MKKIKLTRGKMALIDDDLFEELSQYKWIAIKNKDRRTWYAVRSVRSMDTGKMKYVRMHRQIMGFPEGMVVDHVDHNGLNNQRDNLRNLTVAENNQNQRRYRRSTSKYIGVSLVPGSKTRWTAQINLNKKRKSLGYFTCEVAAAKARDRAVVEHNLHLAKLNFPEDALMLVFTSDIETSKVKTFNFLQKITSNNEQQQTENRS